MWHGIVQWYDCMVIGGKILFFYFEYLWKQYLKASMCSCWYLLPVNGDWLNTGVKLVSALLEWGSIPEQHNIHWDQGFKIKIGLLKTCKTTGMCWCFHQHSWKARVWLRGGGGRLRLRSRMGQASKECNKTVIREGAWKDFFPSK